MEPNWTPCRVTRHDQGLAGTMELCDAGTCGMCTADIEGSPILARMTLAAPQIGRRTTTVEGVAAGNGESHPREAAWGEGRGAQSGCCAPGVISASNALLDDRLNPTTQEITQARRGNIGRGSNEEFIINLAHRAGARIRGEACGAPSGGGRGAGRNAAPMARPGTGPSGNSEWQS